MNKDHIKHWKSITGLKHAELQSRALCKQDYRNIRIKYKAAEIGDRTTYRVLSPERTPFQIGTNQQPHLQKVHE
jgi:hypothetical protein